MRRVTMRRPERGALARRLARAARAAGYEVYPQTRGETRRLHDALVGAGIEISDATVSAWLIGTRTPTPDHLETLMAFLGLADEERDRWRAMVGAPVAP